MTIRCLILWLSMLAVWPAAAAEPAGRAVQLTTAYGTQFDAYVAGPEDAARGIVAVHDRWGLNAPVRAWADRLAGLGFRVVAVDLYDGRPVRPASLAWEYWNGIDPVWMEADLDAALAFLQRRGEGGHVVVAWGRGADPARALVRRSPEAVTALVTYFDDLTTLRSDAPRELPVRVLEISTPRSLVHPEVGAGFGRAAQDAWEATRRFLTGASR